MRPAEWDTVWHCVTSTRGTDIACVQNTASRLWPARRHDNQSSRTRSGRTFPPSCARTPPTSSGSHHQHRTRRRSIPAHSAPTRRQAALMSTPQLSRQLCQLTIWPSKFSARLPSTTYTWSQSYHMYHTGLLSQ